MWSHYPALLWLSSGAALLGSVQFGALGPALGPRGLLVLPLPAAAYRCAAALLRRREALARSPSPRVNNLLPSLRSL